MLLDLTKNLSLILKSSGGVCRDRVSFLHVGYVGSELLVQVIEVNCKVSGPGRGDVVFGVDGDARMVTLVGIEWSQAHRNIQSVVICKLCQW